MTFFAGDVVAYLDEDDNRIRESVWERLRQELEMPDGSVKPFSLVGHSLGSVIAYDFVFALMVRQKIFSFHGSPLLTSRQIKAWQDSFFNLYTMGSPVGLFMMRHKYLWEDGFRNLINPVEAITRDRVWLNIFDKDDLAAYPLERIFKPQSGKALTDVEVNSGIIMPWVHTKYWESAETAAAIAATLPLSG